MNQEIEIKKRSGNVEAFSKRKFVHSLSNCGVSKVLSSKIYNDLKDSIKPGMSTNRLFNLTKKRLQKESKHHARLYSLPSALLQLGPAGFYFEQFIKELFIAQGFRTTSNIVKKGCCISHEVDVIAKSKGRTLFFECKFHNSPGRKNDLKSVLYINARSEDLRKNLNNQFDDFIFASNTKFTKDALQYGQCAGLKILSPTKPTNRNLTDIIVETKIYPVSLFVKQKKMLEKLLEKNVITCNQLLNESHRDYSQWISKEKFDALLSDVEIIIG